MTSFAVKRLLAMACVGAGGAMMSGCAALPTSGPTAGQVVHTAEHSVDPQGIHVVDIDSAVVARSSGEAVADPAHSMATLARPVPVDRIGPGDVLSIQVFEVGAGLFNGGRTLLGEANAPPAASGEALSQGGGIPVAQDGSITLPYVGRLEVAGLTTAQVEDRIVAGLRGKSQSPQVLVTVQQNVSNTVYMMGAVGRTGRLSLTVAHDRLLDAIATAGGTAQLASTSNSTGTGSGPQDYVVRLTRDGRTVEQRLETIEPGSPDDVLLAPGDRITLIRQPRTFMVLGAVDRISQVPFESRVLSLAEALARVGGPNDGRADPHAIYVFRDVPSLHPLPAGTQPAIAPGQAAAQPTIYRLNMMRADGMFLAQRFALQDKDLIYVPNSVANQPQKLAQIVGLLFSPFFAIGAAVR